MVVSPEAGQSAFAAQPTVHTTSPNTRLRQAQSQWASILRPTPPDRNEAHSTLLNPARLKENLPIGDPLLRKGPHTIRIYCQNPNGLRLDRKGGKITQLCQVAREVQADIFGITEHNLDTTQYQVRSIVHATIKRELDNTEHVLASSSIQSETFFKPGGTLILSRGSINSRLQSSGSDALGRWVFQTFTGRNGRKVTVVTAYQVCNKSITQRGRTTAAAQQESLLRQRGESNPNPRLHFRLDLKRFLKQCRESNQEIILMGDFNEEFGMDSHGMTEMSSTLSLVDAMHHQHGTSDFSTYIRGRRRLDYVLMSRNAYNCVQRCGYEPFYHRLDGDHRAFFLDLDENRLFGATSPPMPKPQHRDIHSKKPKEVSQYLAAKHSFLQQRDTFRRIQRLLESDSPDHRLAEILDAELFRGSRVGGKACQSYRDPPWSVKLHLARNRVNILGRTLSAIRTSTDLTHEIERLQREAGSTTLIPYTIRECQEALRAAQRAVSQIVQDAETHRTEEQNENIASHEAHGNKKQATSLRNQRKAEELSNMFGKMRSLKSSPRSKGLSSLQIPLHPDDDPKTCTEWITIEAPDQIVEKLRDRNRQHFGQAQGTPFTVPPLSEHLDFTAATSHAEAILDGNYDTSDLADITALVVAGLHRNVHKLRKPLLSTITPAAFKAKIRTWKESTSTSPSGQHLGHFHALIAKHSHSHQLGDDKDTFDSMQDDIRSAHLSLINYALKHGYSFTRWKTIVNVMIQKDPGNSKIHRLRVIHLYEADYNLLLSLKWRDVLHASEDEGTINDGQYGSRPNRNAHDPVFIENMQSEICRLSRKSVVKFDNDATSCYDRIIASIASIVSRKFGITSNVAFIMADTLETCKYKLKTMLGVSEEFYQHCKLFPIYGTGQGSGNSPVIWCLISSVLFTAHASRAHGAVYESPDKSIRTHIYMIGFVDDSTGQVNSFCDDTQPDSNVLISNMAYDAQLWNDLLWASGGALELSKCTYQVMDYMFTPIGAPILRPGHIGTPIILQSGDGSRSEKIPPRTAYCSHKTLGHHIDPAGNLRQQQRVLTEKSKDTAMFIASSPLSRREAWTYYFSIFLPSIGYTLPNTHFSQKALSKIQAKASSAIIAKCGYNRNTKRLIIFGPLRLGGASFRHLYTEQGIGQIQLFLRHWRSPLQCGTLLRIAYAWAQASIGTSKPFLSDVHTPLPHFESKWLKSLRDFLATINGSIATDTDPVPPTQRVHDCHLMDSVVSNPAFSPSQIRQVNYCRLYLQAHTLSDITMANGVCLDPAIMLGQRSLLSSHTKHHHFKQDRPSNLAWTQWRRACLLWSNPAGFLHQPLGAWLHAPQQLRHDWPAYGSPQGDFYLRVCDGFEQFSPAPNGRLIRSATTTSIPNDSNPVTIIPAPGGWSVDDSPPGRYKPPLPSTPAGTFSEFLQQLDPWETSLFPLLQLFSFPTTIAAYLSNSKASAASDGSVIFSRHGAFGWCLSLRNGTRLATCAGPAFGAKPSSYRAEAYGMLSILRFLLRLGEYCADALYPNILLVCDNLSLVRNVLHHQHPLEAEYLLDEDWSPTDSDDLLQSLKNPSSTMASDWDVLNEICCTLDELPFRPTIRHIKGHQDRDTEYTQLSLSAQLNVDADAQATIFQDNYGRPRPLAFLMPHAGASLQINNETITYNLKSFIRTQAHGPPLSAYIQQRNRWSPTTMSSIDWDAHGLAIQRNFPKRIHITKLVHDILPTNEAVSRYDKLRQPKCPSCPQNPEDRDHILRCSHPERAKWRRQFLQSTRKQCETLRTDPNLQNILIDGLEQWFRESHIDPSKYPPQFQLLIRQQTAIGWRQIFSGRMSNEWNRLQADHAYRNGKRDQAASLLWTTNIICSIWKEWFDLWDLRNGVIHGHDSTSRNKAKRDRAEQEIRLIYDSREAMLPADRDHLEDNAEDHITGKSTQRLQNWLHTYRGLFKKSIADAKKRSVTGVRSIRSYFLPIQEPP